jgi:hypothetical protein
MAFGCKINGALGERIVEARRQHLKMSMPMPVLHECLAGECALNSTVVLLSTVYRYICHHYNASSR